MGGGSNSTPSLIIFAAFQGSRTPEGVKCPPPRKGGIITTTIETLAEMNPDAVILNGLDEALVGHGRQHGMKVVAVYDGDQIIGSLIDTGMTREAAVDYLGFNIEGAYMGENTPIIIWTGAS